MTDFNKISSSVYKNMDFCYTNSRMYSFFNCLPVTAHFSIFFCHLCLLCSSLLPVCSPKQLRVNDRCKKQPGSKQDNHLLSRHPLSLAAFLWDIIFPGLLSEHIHILLSFLRLWWTECGNGKFTRNITTDLGYMRNGSPYHHSSPI